MHTGNLSGAYAAHENCGLEKPALPSHEQVSKYDPTSFQHILGLLASVGLLAFAGRNLVALWGWAARKSIDGPGPA